MVRQAHHPEQSRRANYNDRNSKSQTFKSLMKNISNLFWSLNIEIWNLFMVWCLEFGI